MTLLLALQIFDKLLGITLEFVKSASVEQKQQIIAQHLKTVDFWQGLIEKLSDKFDKEKKDEPKP